MSKVIKLKCGLNIRLKGGPEQILENADKSAQYALKPTDFPGLVPKLTVKVDQKVKAGEPLFFDKYNPEILFTSPVSGKVVAVNRGERRKILEVVVEADSKDESVDLKKADPQSLSVDEIKEQLLKSGMWPFIKQRPYGTFAKTADTPQNIFISCFDSAPLAPDYNFIVSKESKAFQTGIDALAKLTSGKIYLGLPANSSDSVFTQTKNVETVVFDGPHPAGNVGIQIHHIEPINKGTIVWTIKPQEVICIGRLFETGKVDFSKIVALTGSEVKSPQYFQTIMGTSVSVLVDGKTTKEGNERIISGNVLTGTKVPQNNYLGFFDDQLTIIPEGDEYEFMGWADPGFGKFTAGKTFFSKLFPKKEYTINANIHGSERAFVLSGEYEKFVPMDILPVFLLKAILANDIDKMEQLGIYEVIEEDFALCEYACTSKIEVQKILRQGIDVMIKELG